MDSSGLLPLAITFSALVAAIFLLVRCKCAPSSQPAALHPADTRNTKPLVESGGGKKAKKHRKPYKSPVKHVQAPPEAPRAHEHQQLSAAAQELFVDYVKGVNKHVDCIAIAPHAHLIATTTADAKVHVVLDASSTYFFNFREDTFSALDFWCKEQQQDGRAFVCGAMATDGRMVCFEVQLGGKKILAVKELHRSPKPLQKGVVTQLVASKGPWVITRSEGADTELRVHSYSGDLLASVDTKQVENFQLSVSSDGCFFGCAAWAPGVKIFEVKAKGGAFQKVEKAMDIRSSQGLSAFSLSADKSRAATLDKAGKLAVWRIDVRHAAGEDTKLACESDKPIKSLGSTSLHFTVDGSLLIVVSGPDLFLFHAATLELFKAVARATPQPIQHLLVAANNKFLLLCAVPSNAT